MFTTPGKYDLTLQDGLVNHVFTMQVLGAYDVTSLTLVATPPTRAATPPYITPPDSKAMALEVNQRTP